MWNYLRLVRVYANTVHSLLVVTFLSVSSLTHIYIYTQRDRHAHSHSHTLTYSRMHLFVVFFSLLATPNLKANSLTTKLPLSSAPVAPQSRVFATLYTSLFSIISNSTAKNDTQRESTLSSYSRCTLVSSSLVVSCGARQSSTIRKRLERSIYSKTKMSFNL